MRAKTGSTNVLMMMRTSLPVPITEYENEAMIMEIKMLSEELQKTRSQ